MARLEIKVADAYPGYYSAIKAFSPDTIYLARLQVASCVPRDEMPGVLAMLGIDRPSE